MITLKQAEQITALVKAIREADEEVLMTATAVPSIPMKVINELEAKVTESLEALDMFLDEIIDYRTA